MNAVDADGFTTLSAAGCGKTEAVHKLIKLGATKSVVASSWYGTVEAILEGEFSEPDLTSHDVIPLQAQVVDRGINGICDSFGQTPVMWAVENGEVEVFKLLISNYL